MGRVVFPRELCYYSSSRRPCADRSVRSDLPAMKQARTLLLCSSLVLLLSAALPAGATDLPAVLSPSEEQLAAQIGFDREVLLLVKTETRNPLHRLSGYDEDAYQIMANGVIATVERRRSDQVLWSLREKLKPRRYMAFLIESISTLKTDKIAVIRGADPFAILSIMHTNGDEDDLSHEDVVSTLKLWSKRYSYEIVGAGNDWVEIELRAVPQDMKAFAEDIYDFSPDTVDEGAGSVAGLIKDITASGRVMLWWE